MRSATRRKTGKDPEYLEFIRSLPCVCCATLLLLAEPQWRKTEAAHVGNRGLSQKCPDREAIPLCGYHHRTGRYSQHQLGKRFWGFHGIDKAALLAALQAQYDAERMAA